MIPYKQLEKEYAKFNNTKYCVATNTGTSALHLSLVALGIGFGDEVIVPDFTMAACGFAVAYTGARVVTVDCDHTLNIDVDLIEQKITSRTKAIMAVHIYGRLANVEAINKIAKKYNLYVIEDACEVQGAKVGKADLTCFSFYRNKIIHAEEGGAICTNDKRLYEKLQYLKNMAFSEEHDYFHTSIGFNYRMPDTTALQVLQSLKEYPENAKKRRKVEALFDKYCKYQKRNKRDAVWVYDFLCLDNVKVVKDNPHARFFFKPLSTMPMFKQEIGINALFYAKFGAYYNVSPDLTEQQIEDICNL